MTVVEFGLLGPLQVIRAGRPVPLGGPRQRAVLALLLLEANRAVSLDRLVDEVWGERPTDGSVTSVQTYVFHLRRALEPDRPRGAAGEVLVTGDHGYLLRVDPSRVDAAVFQERAAAGRAALDAGRYAEAADELRGALAMWRGPVLADLGDYEFVRQEAARLDELRLAALEARVEADLALGRHHELAAELDSLVATYPLRERLQAHLMLALYRSGRQADALAAYRRVRDLLADELGIDPGEPLRRLHQAVLAQDPTLDWHPDTTPAPVRALGGVSAPATAPAGAPPERPARRRRPYRTVVAVTAVLALLVAGIVALVTRPWSPHRPAFAGNSVGVVDARGGQVGDPAPVGQSPDGLAFGAGAVWAVNTTDGTISRIDPNTHSVVDTIQVGSQPTAVTVTGDDVWVANGGDSSVTRINARNNRDVQTISVGNLPSAIASGLSGVWVTNSGDATVSRIDPATGNVTNTVDVGGGPDGVGVGKGAVWVANGRDGTVSRINPATAKVNNLVHVGAGPKGIAVTPTAVWVTNAFELTVSRIDPSTDTVVATIQVGDGPRAAVANNDSVWVSNEFHGTLTRIDPRTNRPVQRLSIGSSPRGLALVGSNVWVAARAFTASSHRGGTLTVVSDIPPGRFEIDPATAYDPASLSALSMAYDRLVTLRRTGGPDGLTLVPDLATALPAPADGGRTYTFRLRRGIRYSTGEVVRPADIRRGVERQFTAGGPQPGYYAGILGADACLPTVGPPRRCDLSRGIDVDDTASTVTFHLKAPDPDFLHKLAIFVVPVPPGTPAQQVFTNPPPGTGPYMISEHRKGEPVTLVRNPHFHQWSYAAQPAGYPDIIRWQRVTDPPRQVAAVLAGRADLLDLFMDSQPPSVVANLAVQHPTLLHADPWMWTAFLALNTHAPPFNDVRVRRALNYAIDRGTLSTLYGGPARVAITCQMLPPNFPGYKRYCPYTADPRSDGHWQRRDLVKAKQLVGASQTKDTPVRVWVRPGGRAVGEHLVAVLEELGYSASLGAFPTDKAYDDAVWDPRSRLQVIQSIWGADFPAPSNFFIFSSCASSHRTSQNPGNLAEYCNPHLDRLVRSALTAQPLDPGKARRLWAQADRVLTDDSPYVATVNTKHGFLVSPRVGNYQHNPALGALLDQMWVR